MTCAISGRMAPAQTSRASVTLAALSAIVVVFAALMNYPAASALLIFLGSVDHSALVQPRKVRR